MSTMGDGIPLQKHAIGDAEVRAVRRVLGSARLTRGDATHALESAFAAYVKAEHAVAFSSGTAAAFALFQAVEDYGAPFHMTPTNFVGVANAARLAETGNLVFSDIDPKNGHVDFSRRTWCERRLYQHHGGLVQELPSEHTGYAYEDASHALGADDRDGNPVGSCARSRACFFSLHASKLLVAGEGGMVTTNDRVLAARLRLARNAGRDAKGRALVPALNLHMSELQAALAFPQFGGLKRQIFRRRQLVNRYRDMLRGIRGVTLLPIELQHAHHLFQVRVPASQREGLRGHLASQRIETAVHFPALPTLPALTRWPYIVNQVARVPNAVEWGRTALSLPLYSTMTDPQVAVIAYEIRRHMEGEDAEG